jgi:hypothetical protein
MKDFVRSNTCSGNGTGSFQREPNNDRPPAVPAANVLRAINVSIMPRHQSRCQLIGVRCNRRLANFFTQSVRIPLY